MTEVHDLLWGTPISCHAFNKNRTQLAICPNNNEVHIYNKTGTQWVIAHVLAEHDKLITSMDWAPNSNRIVTCSQDRNAYVWTLDSSAIWKPTLVLLRINRAATDVQWSPLENKFAVASGARLISVCYFEEDNDWWVAKHIKKPIRSTVLSVRWHPENILLAAGCADMKARVFSGFIKGVDQKASNAVWGEKLPFGTVCGEFGTDSSGWVHSVAFSPSGNVMAFAGHDSTVNIAYGPNYPLITINTQNLPIVSLIFTSENTIVGAGHDCVPYFFANRGSQWGLVDKVDQGKKRESATGSFAMNKFKQMDTRGQTSTDTELNTTHQNTITSVRPFDGNGAVTTKFSTTGVDGKLVIWDLMNCGINGVVLN